MNRKQRKELDSALTKSILQLHGAIGLGLLLGIGIVKYLLPLL